MLLFVLLTIAVLSIGAIALSTRSLNAIDTTRAELAAAEERALLDAATARAIRALQYREDPLELPKTSRAQPASWQFGSSTVSIFLEREGEKFDVNASDLGVLPRFAANLALSGKSRQTVVDAITRARADHVIISDLGALLPDCERLGNGASRLARSMTIATRQRMPAGLDGAATPDQPSISEPQPSPTTTSPLLTIVTEHGGQELRTLVNVLARAPHVEIIQSTMTASTNDEVCDEGISD
ncbi:hypothetical protein GGR25_001067 [Kaistia hirudinis]|uniref:General secretion pathway protein GspK n=1 Tax=Kaistia hirudinis TaxID=1293440 RepID=A0A840AKY9_9HYPH|nr:hypothetical protein [Kaistia hirudinis]MBB3930028.1 hypothetical protein [Kaistia hirudinis]